MMGHWRRSFVALTRMELVRLLRTREVWTRMLGPALVFPIFMMVVMLVTFVFVSHMGEGRVVALSADVPAELPVATAFESEGWVVRVVDDPKALVAAEEADLAITRWVPGAGVGTPLDVRLAPMDTDFATPGRTHGDRYLWTVHVWDSESTEDERLDPLREVEESVFQALVASHGLPGDALAWPLSMQRVEPDDGGDAPAVEAFGNLEPIFGYTVRPIDVVQVFAAVMASALGLQILGLGPVADRSEGIFETLATTAAPARVVLAARAVSGGAFLWLATCLIAMPLAGVVRMFEEPAFSMVDAMAWMTAAVVFITATYLPVGLWSRSIQDANTLGAYAGGLAMAGGTVLVLLPAWTAVLFSLLWMVLWVMVLGWTRALTAPPKADTP